MKKMEVTKDKTHNKKYCGIKCVNRGKLIRTQRDKEDYRNLVMNGEFFLQHVAKRASKTDECYIAQFSIWRAITSRSSTKWFTVVLMTLMMADRANEFHACYKSRKPFAMFNKPSH